jgi:squalene-hopene/tetraprenyl-beta-curcumene cyclase
MINPRLLRLLWMGIFAASTGILGCRHRDDLVARLPTTSGIDRSLSVAASFLIGQQGQDDLWRPETYGVFKDGTSLTPLVLRALRRTPTSQKLELALRKGTECLVRMVQADGSIDAGPQGLNYPVYTAANAVIVLSESGQERHRTACDAWLAYLRARQLIEPLGWQPDDREYGGWGYATALPGKPRPGEAAPALTESNLSATVFALEALRAAGVPADDPAFHQALTFVKRCQNYADDPKLRDAEFDDGGFFFIYDDPVRNKAGVAGRDRAGRGRYASYGSTTADGLRALLACGLPAGDARVAAARRWIERNFSVGVHPGKYASERQADRPALYFYYCFSVAQALHALDVQEVQTPAGKVAWAEALAADLLKRRRADGCWVNPARAVREDEPVLATSFATMALAVCRDCLAQNSPLPTNSSEKFHFFVDICPP